MGKHCCSSQAIDSNSASDVNLHSVPEGSQTVTVNAAGASIKIDRRSKFAFSLDSKVRKDLENGAYKTSRHPGVRKITALQIPEVLKEAVDIILEGSWFTVYRPMY